MAVAFVALFVAGAGGATAASGLVDGGDIKNNSITGKDVKNGSLLKKDFKRGQLPAGKRGPQGAQGVAGPAGRAGRDGTDGFGELVYSQGVGDLLPAAPPVDDVFAVCPGGTFPTGGDAYYVDENDEYADPQPAVVAQGVAYDFDTELPAAWYATPAPDTGSVGLKLVADAVCANANDVGFVQTSQGKAKAAGLDRAGVTVRRP